MNTWPADEAAARFDECLEACIALGPQAMSRDGVTVAVLIPIGAWRARALASPPSLKDLLLSDAALTEQLVPQRSPARRR